ncbi:hypothetical protein [Methylobacterium sp. WL7]|uniref:hypothetical protein n=1 Tax=Methylobacterium sp. WL7 TaxID=2603900 RepID=UPI0011CBAE21|nr:hypothetical protein [Methylobacterium sp. WL7]TXN48596.1 hypothetical protein FV233_01085 [Methylobacterium sp. WL7]
MRLITPHDVLPAYSRGAIGSGEAIVALGVNGFLDLIVAMADAGHRLPRPAEAAIEAQLDTAMPLPLFVLDDGGGGA